MSLSCCILLLLPLNAHTWDDPGEQFMKCIITYFSKSKKKHIYCVINNLHSNGCIWTCLCSFTSLYTIMDMSIQILFTTCNWKNETDIHNESMCVLLSYYVKTVFLSCLFLSLCLVRLFTEIMRSRLWERRRETKTLQTLLLPSCKQRPWRILPLHLRSKHPMYVTDVFILLLSPFSLLYAACLQERYRAQPSTV